MNHRFLLLVNSPALLLGLVLVGACGASLWELHTLQHQLVRSVHAKVECLCAAHDMAVAVRQLRLHSLLNLLKPNPRREQTIRADQQEFEEALAQAKRLASPGQAARLRAIEDGYRQYRDGLSEPEAEETTDLAAAVMDWFETHPIHRVASPCQELLEANQELVAQSLQDGEQSLQGFRRALLVLALLGPAGGLVCGYSIARALSRSITRLQVRVQDVQDQIAPVVGVVDLSGPRGLDGLHEQMRLVVERVQALVGRMQAQQREIVHAEQLALVGQLAGGITHELRNPLTAMKWLVDEAVRSYPAEPLGLDDLKVLQGEIERMGRTLQGVLDFARPAAPRRVPYDLRETVHQAVELVRARKRQLGVTCELDLPPGPVVVRADAAQLKSVLVNLLLNALDVLPRGGRLTVRLGRAGGDVALTVEDTGPGLAPEVVGRLFEPFASTKPTGTGLGLNVSRRFVEEHGGRLTGANRPEGGARFTMTLPAAEEEALCLSRAS